MDLLEDHPGFVVLPHLTGSSKKQNLDRLSCSGTTRAALSYSLGYIPLISVFSFESECHNNSDFFCFIKPAITNFQA